MQTLLFLKQSEKRIPFSLFLNKNIYKEAFMLITSK